MKKESKKKLKRYGILGGIFAAALLVYFVWSFASMERSNMIYASLDEPKLPMLYAEMNGRRMNPMHGYVQDMGNQAARDSLTVLPEDRALKLWIDEYDNMVVSVQYEIRSLDLSRLIENGSVSGIDRQDGSASVVLPIQNLIQKEQEYLLSMTVDTGEQTLHYYTRILWTDKPYAAEMLTLATDFTEKSFDYNAARELTMYLESDETADNSSLGHVNLKSNYSQLTWAGTGMQLAGEPLITLKECSGVMGAVQIRYETVRTAESGATERFVNEDNFVMRYDPQRIFLMDFDRVTNEVFDAAAEDFSGKRAVLGVTAPEQLQTVQSDSERFIAFRTADGIWRYDQDEKQGRSCVNVFTYRSEQGDIRANYPAHDMKILSCKNNGDVAFLVYGYINRGRHEGYNGIVYYTYDNSEDTIVENFFIPVAEQWEKIKYDVERLSYLSDSGMLYLYQQNSIYGIDTRSLEVITIASALSEGEFATSASGASVAWQNGGIVGAESITLMDLKQDNTSEIRSELPGCNVRALGFVGEDFVYGSYDVTDAENVSLVSEVPLRELRIIAPDLTEQTRYEKAGKYLNNVEVESSRIRLDLVGKTADGRLTPLGSDTIVCNQSQPENLRHIDSYISNEKGRVYFVEISDLEKRSVRVRAPHTISYMNTSFLELNPVQSETQEQTMFDAWAYGHFVGTRRSLAEAAALVYDSQGYVVDEAQNMLWNRTDKETVVNIREPIEAARVILEHLEDVGAYSRYENVVLMNVSGMDLNSALYFVGKGIPLAAFHADGGCLLITGYDAFNVTLVNPLDGGKSLMGKNDAAAHFAQQGNRYVAALRLP